MREILFRGKKIDNGEWVEGCLFKMWKKTYILWGTTNNVPDMIEVIPETVGQYTGLTDKNGVKIFEGDIVTIPGSKRMGLPAEIWYNELKTTFEIRRTGFNNISLFEAQEWCEVIGNIHDNPELLGVGE